MYKALKSFTGVITMGQGEIKEIKDKDIVKDLLNAGYIIEEKKSKPVKEEKPAEKKKKATKKK